MLARAELSAAITADHRAVGLFLDDARAIPAERWAAPRAPGKWSPSQVTEHVAIAYEQSRRMLDGSYTGMVFPWIKQVMARMMFLRPMLRRGDFPKGPFQAPDFLRPSVSAPAAAELLPRLDAAVRDLEGDLVTADDAGRTTFVHPLFGRLPLTDLLRLQMLHMEHHRPQLAPVAQA